MYLIKDKKIVVGADISAYKLKDKVVEHLKANGWDVLDVGVKSDADASNIDMMFQRVGFRIGHYISEGIYERAIAFCGTGMGIHLAASKCPKVIAGVVESLPSAIRAITGNGVNVLAIGANYVDEKLAISMVDSYLKNNLGDGYDLDFYKSHKFAIDEINDFDYNLYKENGFKIK